MPDPAAPEGPRREVEKVTDLYCRLRNDCEEFEELLGSWGTDPGELTAKDLKRLDKATTVLKIGFKLMKKVMKAHEAKTVRAKLRRAA